MRPAEHDFDEEIRGHLALSIRERVSRWLDAVAGLGRDLRVGLRSLLRAKSLAATVVVTLALGIGANAAIFSVVRGVLLRPLVNRGEDRIVYIRQSAPGLGAANLTFSVPEIEDFKAHATTIGAFGDFSTISFTLIGVGEPRVVQAGVVGGSYFEVMGLRPVLGRLLTPADDGPGAASVVVLTHRFWKSAFNSDPTVVGKTIRLGGGNSTVVGVLEPSLPYPFDTEIIANVVTSPHHLGATMRTQRTHRMTELFGRLADGASVDEARTELIAAHAAMMHEHPEAYSARADVRLSVTPLRDQITAPARTILLVLLAAAAVVFVIACANVASLILARSVRREGELAVRAALGASRGALRRTLLAESLVLCGAGAVLGIALAQPLVEMVSRFAARFSVRALEVTVDASVLWVGAGLAMAAAVLLAYVPPLPSAESPSGFGLASGSLRITPGTNRRLRLFATAQIAFSFVLLAGATTLVAALVALQAANTGYTNLRQVLAIDLPTPSIYLINDAREMARYQEMVRRIDKLPGVQGAALGNFVPWRDAGTMGPGFPFMVEGYTPADGEENPNGRMRFVTPGFFSALGVPILAGRDFTDADHAESDPVAIVSESVPRRLFPNGEAIGRRLWWTEPPFGKPEPYRIVGVVADVDDENVVRGPALTIYRPVGQTSFAGRLFVHAAGDPYALVPTVTRIIRTMSANQPVERAATLADVRAEVLAPDRLSAFVVSGFAGVALLIAVVGVAGVLAFSVSARTRELGVRLALGATPRRLLLRVLLDGVLIVAIGIVAGAAGGYGFARVATGFLENVHLPGAVPLLGVAIVLVVAAVVASLIPAARASRVDVIQALRSE
jgi:predicted permease